MKHLPKKLRSIWFVRFNSQTAFQLSTQHICVDGMIAKLNFLFFFSFFLFSLRRLNYWEGFHTICTLELKFKQDLSQQTNMCCDQIYTRLLQPNCIHLQHPFETEDKHILWDAWTNTSVHTSSNNDSARVCCVEQQAAQNYD